MTAASEWVTDEERPAVEAAIQEALRVNGHPPLPHHALNAIVAAAAHMTAVYWGTEYGRPVTSNALSIVDAFYPPPPMEHYVSLSNTLWEAMQEPALPLVPYRPEPPKYRRMR